MITTGWSDRKKIFVILGLLGFAFFYGSFFAKARINNSQNEESVKARLDDIKVVKFSPNPTLEPSPTPNFSPEPTLEPSPTPSLSPKPTPAPTLKPTSVPIASPTPTSSVQFDKNMGNNYVAAKYAQDIMNTTNKAVPNFILDSYLELSPENMNSQEEETYKKKVSSAFLTVSVNNLFWNQMNDNSKKDVVGSFVVSVGNIFPGGYPHITVSNGIRTVATGEYNWLKTEPKVTLK
ncbi:MAG: hypothetical protein V1810_03420 [Candidatus Beckwithbacteria bacterium]